MNKEIDRHILDISRTSDVISSYSDLKAFRQADLKAYGINSWRFHYRLTMPGLYYQRVMRDVEFLYGTKLKFLGRIRHAYLKLLSIVTGISVPPGVFGRGLSLPHYGSVVVNDKVRAGRFCRIHSSTNIGESKGAAPILGDGVYVAPGAVIFGGIQIGSKSAVGANSVVGKDVPPNCVVAGAPANVVSESGIRDVMPQWILLEIDNLGGV